MQQHARIDQGRLRNMVEDGLVTTTGAVLLWFEIRLKEGWSCKISPKEICDEINISRSSFYRAIDKLTSDGWLIVKQMEVSRGPKSCCPKFGTDSQNWDSQSQNWDRESQNWDRESQIWENESLEVAQGAGLRDRSSFFQLLSSYQLERYKKDGNTEEGEERGAGSGV